MPRTGLVSQSVRAAARAKEILTTEKTNKCVVQIIRTLKRLSESKCGWLPKIAHNLWKKTKHEMFFLIVEMSRRHNVLKMKAEQSGVEPDLACSGALSLTTSGFVWHCPFVDTVKFSCLLGCCRQTGTMMTCPAQCYWLAQCHCRIITCLLDWSGSRPLE